MVQNFMLITAEHPDNTLSSLVDSNSPAGDGSVTYNLTLPLEELSLDRLIEQILAITLDRCHGNKSKAAKMLKIPRKTFYRPEFYEKITLNKSSY